MQHHQRGLGLGGALRQPGGGEWTETPVILKAGEVSFHQALTFHGSGPNHTASPRLSVVAHMMPGVTVYRAGRAFHGRLSLLGPNAHDGQPLNSDSFPQLWPVSDGQAL